MWLPILAGIGVAAAIIWFKRTRSFRTVDRTTSQSATKPLGDPDVPIVEDGFEYPDPSDELAPDVRATLVQTPGMQYYCLAEVTEENAKTGEAWVVADAASVRAVEP